MRTEIKPNFTETTSGHPANIATIQAKKIPSTNPMNPPNAVKIQDSMRNCINTFPRVAPSALRIPISRVRSVTDTSMIFITPIPPTKR